VARINETHVDGCFSADERTRSSARVWVCGGALALTLAVSAPALAQCEPGWLPEIGAPGANNSVRSLTVMPNGDIVAGGSFTVIGPSLPAPNKFARYSVATGTWSAPNVGTNGSIVHALAALPDGDLLLGGNFSSIGGVATRQFARYDFDTDTFSGLGYGNNGGRVNAILLIDNENVIIGGLISRIAGVVANHIGRHNLTTGVWTPMNSQMVSSGDEVTCLALAPDGTVIVGGTFLNGGGSGVGALRIARYHPTTNTWSTLGSGMNNTVSGVAVLPDGDVVAGGYFTTAGGVPVNQVARYDVDTGVWSDMGGGISGIFDYIAGVDVLPDGNIVIGGSFGNVSGVAANRIAHYNSSTGVWSSLGTGVNADIEVVAAVPNGNVVAGGFFTNAGGTSAARIAQYSFGGSCCPACAADYDDNGGVDGGDLSSFFADFEAGEACADIDGNGGVDGGDLSTFFTLFEAGGC
jgi:hypothetical protein